jgi:Concanavalin A-like lectin/glucanases superfamily
MNHRLLLLPILLAAACVGDEPTVGGSLTKDAGDGSDAQVATGDAGTDATAVTDAADGCDKDLVSLYHGENDTLDALTRNPAFWPSSARYTQGRVGNAFDLQPPPQVSGVPPKTNAPFVGLTQAGDAGAMQAIDALTISAWVRQAHPDAGAVSAGIALGPLVHFSQPPDAANVNIRNVLTFGINRTGADPFVQIVVGPAGAVTLVNFDTNSVPGPTDWTHYVVVFKQISSTETSMQAFVNSVSKGIKPLARAMPQIPQDAYLELGGYSNEMDRAFGSALDEIAIYKRALSNDQVTALYASRAPLNCP